MPSKDLLPYPPPGSFRRRVSARWIPLVDAWLEWLRVMPGVDEPWSAEADEALAAWEDVDQAVTDADDDVTDLLVALADVSPDDATLAYLGAGPVEDLIKRHGARFVDRIDQAAIENPRFRSALRCVYYGDVDPSIVARLSRFGPPW